MTIPADLKYTKSHEWIKLENDGSITVGITHHAQDLLGDMVFVEPPVEGTKYAANKEVAVVESVKAASDVYAPISGEITAVNAVLQDTPEKINQAPYEAWIFKMKPENAADLNSLLDAAAYKSHVASEAH